MKKEPVTELWERFEVASGTIDGVECWSARDLKDVFGYAKWDNFVKVVDKAKETCSNAREAERDHFADIRKMAGIGSAAKAGERATDHFVGVTKMVGLGSGAQRPIDDFALTRHGCHLIVQNGKTHRTSSPANFDAIIAMGCRAHGLVAQRADRANTSVA